MYVAKIYLKVLYQQSGLYVPATLDGVGMGYTAIPTYLKPAMFDLGVLNDEVKVKVKNTRQWHGIPVPCEFSVSNTKDTPLTYSMTAF